MIDFEVGWGRGKGWCCVGLTHINGTCTKLLRRCHPQPPGNVPEDIHLQVRIVKYGKKVFKSLHLQQVGGRTRVPTSWLTASNKIFSLLLVLYTEKPGLSKKKKKGQPSNKTQQLSHTFCSLAVQLSCDLRAYLCT